MVGTDFMIKMVQSVLDAVLVVLVGTQQGNLCANDLQLGVAEFWAMQLTHYTFHLTPFWTNNFSKQINGSVMVVMVVVVVVVMMVVVTCLVTMGLTVVMTGCLKSTTK
jgi:hypothetical protein